MQDHVDFAYNFQSLYLRLSLSKFFDRNLYSRQRSNDDLITDYIDVHTFLWIFYSLQIYQLSSIVIHSVTACHNDERHLIKDFNKRKE